MMVEKKENYDEKYEDLKAGKPMLMESPRLPCFEGGKAIAHGKSKTFMRRMTYSQKHEDLKAEMPILMESHRLSG
jgi:hypothetical protein